MLVNLHKIWYWVIFCHMSVWSDHEGSLISRNLLGQRWSGLFTPWVLPSTKTMDVQKSLLTISDQYHNFYFCDFVYKMAAGGHFGSPKLTFDGIFGHFRSIRNFFIKQFYKMAAGTHFGCPKFTFERISGHFRSICNFKFLTKWLPSITFLAILDQYGM